MRRVAARGLPILCFSISISCAPALRGPIELPAPGDAAVPADETADRAVRAFERGDVRSAGEAARLWLEVATATGHEVAGLVGAVRALAWLAEHDPDGQARAGHAAAAVDAGRRCELVAPADARCAYWLAVAVGLQARERRSTALDGLEVMVDRLGRAVAADPALERGGPHRVLALVYLRAPGWPTGPGDPEEGLRHARLAVGIAPGHPPNLLALGEALRENGDVDAAREAYATALELAETSPERDAEAWRREAREGLNAVPGR